MKYIFSFFLMLNFINFSYSQTFLFRPIVPNYNFFNYNNNNLQQKQQNNFTTSSNTYLYYPLSNIPPIQSSGYTLQNTQPYVNHYYFNSEVWLLKR